MSNNYTIEPFPLERKIIMDSVRLGQRRPMISGFIEVDVTNARPIVRTHDLSFTAFLLTCLGKAVAEHKHVHALRNWRGQLVIYDDVDVSILIEIDLSSHKFPVAHVVRATNQRDIGDITAEIRNIQNNPDRSATLSLWKWPIKLFMRLPTFMRLPLYRFLTINPHRVQRIAGTVLLTAVGMFGEGNGWGSDAGLMLHSMGVLVGGIGQKPGIVYDENGNAQIAVREYLSLTVSFDHDIVDGAPAARFTSRFKELIEADWGLPAISD